MLSLFCLSFSRVQIDSSVVSNWGYAGPLAQAICYINEYRPDVNGCFLRRIVGNWSARDDAGFVINQFEQCTDKVEKSLLSYFIQSDAFVPRVEFYTNLENKNVKLPFEPRNASFVFSDLTSAPVIEDNKYIRPIIPSINSHKQYPLKGYSLELRPFRYSMEYGVKDISKNKTHGLPLRETKTELAFSQFNGSSDQLISPLYSLLQDSEEPIENLRKILENWPLYANTIAHVPVPSKLEKKIRKYSPQIEPGSNTLTLNGRVIDEFEPFTFGKNLEEELRIQQILGKEFGMDASKRHFFAQQGLTKPPIYIDIRNGPILWLNDLEKDLRYKRWSKSVKPLKDTKKIPASRNNVVNAVVIIDPSQTNGLKLFKELSDTITTKQAAIHAGILFTKDSIEARKIVAASKDRMFDKLRVFSKSNSSLQQAFDQVFNESVESVDCSFVESKGIVKDCLWINGLLVTEGDLVSDFYLHCLSAYHWTTFEQDKQVGFFTVDQVFMQRKPIKKLIPVIHKERHFILPIVEMSFAEQQRFIHFVQETVYAYEDEEQTQVTIFLFNATQELKEAALNFLHEPHSVATRIAFMEDFPFDTRNWSFNAFINGRLMNLPSDFDDFEELTRSLVPDFDLERNNDLNLYWIVCSNYFLSKGIVRAHLNPNLFDDSYPGVFVKEKTSELSVECVLDPFSQVGQQMIGFIAHLVRSDVCSLSLLLNPSKNATLPSSFWRFVDDETTIFENFHPNVTYSLLVHPPKTWIVAQEQADVDLDNILSRELGSGRYIGRFILKNLVTEGSVGQSGVSLSIPGSDALSVDPFGYWQLKSKPGISLITSNSETSSRQLLTNSFAFHKEDYQSWGAKEIPEAKDDGKTHVFIVASGRLYERLAKIAMLSALKHCSTPMKFWFFQNYLSPQFRTAIGKMSRKYKFEAEFITYSWPWWLERQSEKQRIVWGHKILFLDLMFPLSLKRVIYVDADQIIRTDLRELMTLDLGDAPYGFTPFCDSRIELEPYRFWKHGYWRDYLSGKNYHISALFVVDLQRFREIEAGPWLRRYYQELVKDSESLANLDQDLPNYAQWKIPIFSLPQEWLWCETWCSDDTMSKAKTIDLCNNPYTKIPKLEIARTRVNEWPGLDREAESIEEELLERESEL